jgi:hypothetical protein
MKSHHRTGSTAAAFADSGIGSSSRPPAEDARPSVQAALRLRSRLAARRPTGSLTLRLSLRLNAWTRDWRSQRTKCVRGEFNQIICGER